MCVCVCVCMCVVCVCVWCMCVCVRVCVCMSATARHLALCSSSCALLHHVTTATKRQCEALSLLFFQVATALLVARPTLTLWIPGQTLQLLLKRCSKSAHQRALCPLGFKCALFVSGLEAKCALCPLIACSNHLKYFKASHLLHLVIGSYSRFLFKQNGRRLTIAWI